MPIFSDNFKPIELEQPIKEIRNEIRAESHYFEMLTLKLPEQIRQNNITKAKVNDISSLREWWHTILRNRGKYPCYAIFLVLPSDEQANQYLTNFGKELAIVSGWDCLFIILGGDNFFTVGNKDSQNSEYDDYYVKIANKHISSGESVKVAELFDVSLTEFPCVIFFQNIQEKKYAILPLKNLSVNDIALEFRQLFSEIHKGMKKDKSYFSVLSTIEWYLIQKDLKKKKKDVSFKIMELAESTIQSVLDAWVKSNIK